MTKPDPFVLADTRYSAYHYRRWIFRFQTIHWYNAFLKDFVQDRDNALVLKRTKIYTQNRPVLREPYIRVFLSHQDFFSHIETIDKLLEREAKVNGPATRSKWLHDLNRGCLHSASRDSLPQLEYQVERKGSSSHDFTVDEMVELDDDKGIEPSWMNYSHINNSLVRSNRDTGKESIACIEGSKPPAAGVAIKRAGGALSEILAQLSYFPSVDQSTSVQH